jgi:hypothetical protein
MIEAPTSWRDQRGRFAPGNPGGKGGHRRRAFEFRKAAEEAITPEHIAALVRKTLRMALEGNLAATKVVLDRTIGRAPEAPSESEPLSIDLPFLGTAADCSMAIDKVLEGVCNGSVDKSSAQILITGVQARLHALGTVEFERRLSDMERSTAHTESLSKSQRSP